MTTEMQMVERREPEAELAEKLGMLSQAAEARKLPLRVRVQPAVLNHETKLYVSLPGVSWMFDVPGKEQVLAVKDSMDLFFRCMAKIGGPDAMREYMQGVLVEIEKVAAPAAGQD